MGGGEGKGGEEGVSPPVGAGREGAAAGMVQRVGGGGGVRVHAELGGRVVHMCKWLLCKQECADVCVQMCGVHVWGLLCAHTGTGCNAHTHGLGL